MKISCVKALVYVLQMVYDYIAAVSCSSNAYRLRGVRFGFGRRASWAVHGSVHGWCMAWCLGGCAWMHGGGDVGVMDDLHYTAATSLYENHNYTKIVNFLLFQNKMSDISPEFMSLTAIVNRLK